jgi:hypothetical protein
MEPRAAANRTNPAAAAAAPRLRSDEPEHIYIGSEEAGGDPAQAARTPRATFTLDDPVRREGVVLTLYAESILEIRPRRKRTSREPIFLDLRFLDPVPRIERVIAVRWLYTALGSGAAAALASFLLRFEILRLGATAALAVMALVSAATLYLAIRRSHEKTEFRTLHGRSTVLELVASVLAMKKFRAVVPMLTAAIEEAAEQIGADTAAYLRAEMREHYRLRSAGVLDNEECAASTGRILAQFDVQI